MTCEKMGWLQPILPILLASVGLQLCLARPQGQWELKNSQQVAQPIYVHTAQDSPFPFPRFAIPENRRQDNPWSLAPNEVQQVESSNVRNVRPGDQVAIVVRDHQREQPHTDVISLLASLRDVQSNPAHPVFLAPPDYPAPQGARKFNVTYVVPAHVQDQPASNPHPPLFVAPLHYQVPNGYGRIQVPVRHVKFAIPESPVAQLIAPQQAAPIPNVIVREQPRPQQEFVQPPPTPLVQQQPVFTQAVPQPQNTPVQWEPTRPSISSVAIPNTILREEPQPQLEFVQVPSPTVVELQPVPPQVVPQQQNTPVQWEPARPTLSNVVIPSGILREQPVQPQPQQDSFQVVPPVPQPQPQQDSFQVVPPAPQPQPIAVQWEPVRPTTSNPWIASVAEPVAALQPETVPVQFIPVQEIEFHHQAQDRPIQTEKVQQVQEVEFRSQSENRPTLFEEVQQIETAQQNKGSSDVQTQDLFQVQEAAQPVQEPENGRFVLAADKPAFLENEEPQQQLGDVPPFNEVTPVRDQVSVVPLVLAVERPAFLEDSNAKQPEPVAQEEPLATLPQVLAVENPSFQPDSQFSEPVMEHGFRPLFPTVEESVQTENDQTQAIEEISSEDQFQAMLELQREAGLRHATFVPQPAFEPVPTLFQGHSQNTAAEEPEVSIDSTLPVQDEPTLVQTEEVRANFEAPIQTQDVQIPVAVQSEEINADAQVPLQQFSVQPVFVPETAEPVEALRGDVSPKDDSELQSIQPLEAKGIFSATPVLDSVEQTAPVVEQTVAPTTENVVFVPELATTTVQPTPEPATAAPQAEAPRGRIVPAAGPVKVSSDSDTVSSPNWPDFQSVRRKQINRQQVTARQNIPVVAVRQSNPTEVVRTEEPVAPVFPSGQGAVYGQKIRARVKSNLFVPTEPAPKPTLAAQAIADPDPPVIEREEPFQSLESQNSASATGSVRGRLRFRPKAASSEESSESAEQPGTTTITPLKVTTTTAPSRRRPASTTATQRIRGRVRLTTTTAAPTTTTTTTTTEAVTESVAPEAVEVVEEKVSTPEEEPIINEAPESKDLLREVQETVPRTQDEEETPAAALEEETNEESNDNAANEEVIPEVVLVEEEPEIAQAPVTTERPVRIRGGRRPVPRKEEEVETSTPPRRRRPINRFRDSSSFRSTPTNPPVRPHLFRAQRPVQPVVDREEPEEISGLSEGFSPLSVVFGTRQTGKIATPSAATAAPQFPVGRRVPQNIRISRPAETRGSGEDLGSEGSEWTGASGPSSSAEVDDSEGIIADRLPAEEEKIIVAMDIEDAASNKETQMLKEMSETATEDSANDRDVAPLEVQTVAESEDVAESDPATEMTHQAKEEVEAEEKETEQEAPMNTETSETEEDDLNDSEPTEVQESPTDSVVEPSETAVPPEEPNAEVSEATENDNERTQENVAVPSETMETADESKSDSAPEVSTQVVEKADEPTEDAETAHDTKSTEDSSSDKVDETAEAVTENASIAAVSAEGRAIDSQAADSQVLGVSTATEVSLMYELCFRGRCIRVHE